MNKEEIISILTVLLMAAITVCGGMFANSDMGFAFVGVINFFIGAMYGCYLGYGIERGEGK